jgi:hypothetical protein
LKLVRGGASRPGGGSLPLGAKRRAEVARGGTESGWAGGGTSRGGRLLRTGRSRPEEALNRGGLAWGWLGGESSRRGLAVVS